MSKAAADMLITRMELHHNVLRIETPKYNHQYKLKIDPATGLSTATTTTDVFQAVNSFANADTKFFIDAPHHFGQIAAPMEWRFARIDIVHDDFDLLPDQCLWE